MRVVLKYILKWLSQWAIRKHELELVVVTGYTGVDLAKEGIYTTLSQKFIVRRNIKEVWWDLSIPLNILGYADRRRSVSGWINLIFRAIFVLLFGPKNPSILVLSAESEKPNTAKYWASFIVPNYLIILNKKDNSTVTNALLQSLNSDSKLVVNEDLGDIKTPAKVILFGKSEKSKVRYTINEKSVVFSQKDKNLYIENYYLPKFSIEIVAAILTLSILKSVSFDDSVNGLLKFDLRDKFLTKVSSKLGDE